MADNWLDQSASKLAQRGKRPDGLFGFKIRDKLHPGEIDYFKANPNVTGMASEMNDIILNPFASGDINRDAVAKNEALRLLLRQRAMTPAFDVTDAQRKAFIGTPYEEDETALRSTIAGRIYSGDPSAQATPEQEQWLQTFISEQ